jgi:hypothetical protein
MPLKRRSVLGALVAALLVLILLYPSASVSGQTQATNVVNVFVQVRVNPLYDVYGSGTSVVTGVINASSLSLSQSTWLELLTTSKPTILTATTVVNDIPQGVKRVSLVSANGLHGVNFTVPAHASNLSITFQEFTGGSGFLWRYITAVPYVEVTSHVLGVLYTTTLTVPSGTVFSQLYTGRGGSLPSASAILSGRTASQWTYSLSTGVALIVMQSNLFVPASIAITSVALAALVLVGLNLFPQGRLALNKIKDLTKGLRISRAQGKFRFRSLLSSRKLLALFILCAIVMAAGAAVGGPDPRVTAYVLAAPGSVAGIQSSLQQVAENVQVITPSEDFTDFAVMSSVGQFSMVVVSNYPAADLAEVSPFILGSLGNVPVIIVDNSVNSSSPTLANTIETLYGNSVVPVNNASALTAGERSTIAFDLEQSRGSNILGVSLGEREFEALAITEAVLSLGLVFLGWAYLGSVASDKESRADLSHIVTVIGAGIFVFVFSEAVYVGVSSLLRFPLSLHAVSSDAHDLTAIGALGFGGGSTPRLAVGFLGILVGLVGTEGGLIVKKSDFALVSATLLLIFANPFSIGQFAYQALLGFVPLASVGPAATQLGLAYTDSISLKEFILGVGSALGGSVTPTYLLSAGKTLFFASLVPLAYLKKLGRTTTAIAVIVIALIAGDGGVRVGEMTPDKTVIAILPGLTIGFVFAAILLGFGLLEKYARGNWRPRA